MGRELQKKKNRSSISKIRQKPKSKKRVNPRSNPIIAANWDQSLTLAQNYRQLGLLSKLNARSGGVEKSLVEAKQEQAAGKPSQDPLGLKPTVAKTLSPGEAKVERDPDTGAILRVIQTTSGKPNPLNDPLNDLSDEYDEEATQEKGSSGPKEPSMVVRKLEAVANMEVKPRPRQQSTREEEWIAQLVDKYGDNYKRMMRDKKLNPYQQTEADIARRIKKWKARNESS